MSSQQDALSSAPSRGLVRATIMLGGAQLANVVMTIARMKVIAVMLGPVGVGVLGMYGNLMEAIAVFAGLGMNTSGVRQLARVSGDLEQSTVRRLLLLSLAAQGALAMLAVWLLRRQLAVAVFGDAARSDEVGLVGVAVFCTLLALSQTAVLQGLRHVGDLSRATTLTSIIGTIVGLVAVWIKREDGLVLFLIIQPLTAAAVAFLYVRRIPTQAVPIRAALDRYDLWRTMVKLGAVFMLAGLIANATFLVARAIVAHEIGLAAAGFLAASWGISIQSIGFLFASMAADFYPRMTEVIAAPQAVVRLVNDQVQLSLAIAGPVLLLLIGLAPWLIVLLYSDDFKPAAPLMQWLLVGNIFRLASLPISLTFVAGARMGTFVGAEVLLYALFLALLWFGLAPLGVESAGPAFLLAFAIYTVVLTFAARKPIGFVWQPRSLWLVCGHAALTLSVLALSHRSPWMGAVVGICSALASGAVGLRIVVGKSVAENRAAIFITGLFKSVGWPINR